MKFIILHNKDTIMVKLLDDFSEGDDFEDETKTCCFFLDKENAKELAKAILHKRREIMLEKGGKGEVKGK